MPVSSKTQAEWARLGAIARLQQLETERAAILAAFPDLKRKGAAAAAAPAAGRRRKLSAAARRAMSDGMKRYWAKRRAQKNQAK